MDSPPPNARSIHVASNVVNKGRTALDRSRSSDRRQASDPELFPCPVLTSGRTSGVARFRPWSDTMLMAGARAGRRLSRRGGGLAAVRLIAVWQREGGDNFISGVGDLEVAAESLRAVRQVEEVAWVSIYLRLPA